MKIHYLVLALFATVVFSGCETLRGFAKDVENTGENLYELFTGQK